MRNRVRVRVVDDHNVGSSAHSSSNSDTKKNDRVLNILQNSISFDHIPSVRHHHHEPLFMAEVTCIE